MNKTTHAQAFAKLYVRSSRLTERTQKGQHETAS